MSEIDVTKLYREIAVLQEQSRSMMRTLDDFRESFRNIGARISKLEEAEHKRKGGTAMLLALIGAAGSVGVLAGKFLGN
jgi:hypothetical protein